MRVGVLGGTFDPIHIGHLAAGEDAAHALDLDRVLYVPNRVPPHKEVAGVGKVADRLAMVELALADNDRFAVSTVELRREGPSYTVDTMRELQHRLGPDADLYFLVGCDALPHLHTWHQPEALLNEFHVVVMDRALGHGIDWAQAEEHMPDLRDRVRVVHVAQLEISGEDLRRRVREGRPIRYQVTPAVERYIQSHGLYCGVPASD